MKVLLVGPLTSVHLRQWAEQLRTAGVDVDVATLHPDARYLGPTQVLPWQRGGYVLAARTLRKFVESTRPNIVHAHYATGYGTLARLARLADIAPLVISVWGSDVFDFPTRSPFHAALVRANLASARLVCSTSEAMIVPTVALGVPRSKVRVVPFGIDERRFVPYSREPGPTTTIGTVKSLEVVYGIDTLLRAFALLLPPSELAVESDIRLTIAGAGSQLDALQLMAHELHISPLVRFIGPVEHPTVPELLSSFDIFAALSRSESFGLAMAEAAAMELPVVSTTVGGIPEVVIDGTSGLLVTPDAPRDAALALRRLVLEPRTRATFGRSGRRHVLDHFGWRTCVNRQVTVYEEAVA